MAGNSQSMVSGKQSETLICDWTEILRLIFLYHKTNVVFCFKQTICIIFHIYWNFISYNNRRKLKWKIMAVFSDWFVTFSIYFKSNVKYFQNYRQKFLEPKCFPHEN